MAIETRSALLELAMEASSKALEFRHAAVKSGGFGAGTLHQIADIHAYYTQKIEALTRTAAVRPEWLPIESAPRDGARLLLGYAGLVVIGKWTDEEAKNPCSDFTHWMPLPRSPGLAMDDEPPTCPICDTPFYFGSCSGCGYAASRPPEGGASEVPDGL